MQRERSAFNSFPEPIDLNQGSLPENTSMDHSPTWNNFLNPVENQLSNYMLGGTDENINHNNAANEAPRNLNSITGHDARSDWSFSNQANNRPLSMQNHSSNRASLNLNSNHSWDHESHRGPGAYLPHQIHKPVHSETETLYGSSSNVGTFSGSSSESRDVPGPSFGTWGSSCKRKTLEGTSGQFYPGGSSSSNHPTEKNIMQHPFPGSYSASGSLSISSGPPNLPTAEHLSLGSGVGTSRVAPGLFPSSSAQGVVESSRTFGTRSNHGLLDPFPFDTPRSTSVRNTGVYVGPSELRSQTTLPVNQSPNTLNQSRLMHSLNEARGTHSYPWNGSFGSRGGSSSSSGAHGESNIRSPQGNNLDYPMTVSAHETRNVLPDQIDWSFAPGTSASSRSRPSGSRVGPTAGVQTYSAPLLLPHQFQNHQRVSESSPWAPSNRVGSESGTRRSNFSLFPSASSLPEEAAGTSRAQQQLDQRAEALSMDIAGEDVNGWRALSTLEGRHRLIRQVLNAMRRGVHLQPEDYMLIDPVINGFAELHDRHRDMRLDVDNMSYEELLALEDRIGNVSTGLSEEKIRASMKQRKYEITLFLPNLEPCCICQEDYVTGEDVATLDCGHEFHTNCIKQWLTLKNLCPICKMTALGTCD